MTTPTKAEALDALRALNDYFREHPQPYDVMGDLNIVQRYVERSANFAAAFEQGARGTISAILNRNATDDDLKRIRASAARLEDAGFAGRAVD